ncbi:hypothetical protein DQ04_00961150 [Trypanosoma grayi]|uniref:hypothetical protein n=1 Tax=Trypanosoma grayi TaxID=71804 RepID=UPI0004F46757|nr:hypothetical protein DQ04_00961150 [Trypanosoma grayi]KEG13522.1 hypothetical protein DQ04_00961150 [Trypanosoma grayi]
MEFCAGCSAPPLCSAPLLECESFVESHGQLHHPRRVCGGGVMERYMSLLVVVAEARAFPVSLSANWYVHLAERYMSLLVVVAEARAFPVSLSANWYVHLARA